MTQFINQLGTSDIASIAASLKAHANTGASISENPNNEMSFAGQLLAMLEPGNNVSGLQSALSNPTAVETLSARNPEFNHLIQNLQDEGFVTFIPQGQNISPAQTALNPSGNNEAIIAVVPITSLDKIAHILNTLDPALLDQGVQVAIQQQTSGSLTQPEIVGSADIKAQSKQVLGLDSLKGKNALGLDTVVLFTQADGSAEAPLLEEGKVYLAPLSDVLSSSDNLSFQKTVSEKELPLLIVKKANAAHTLSQAVAPNPNVVIAQSNETYGLELNNTPLSGDHALLNAENTALGANSHRKFLTLSTSSHAYSLAHVANAAQTTQTQTAQTVAASVPVPTTSPDTPLMPSQDFFGGDAQSGHDQTADQDLFVDQQINNNFDPNAVVKEARRERSGFAQHILNNANAHHAAKAHNQVAMMLEKGANGQLETIRLQLDPASLGKVEIEFDFSKEGHVKALIIADKQETLDILKQDSRNLEAVLEDAGFDMDQGDLEFDLRQDQEFGHNNFGTPSRNDNADFDPFLRGTETYTNNPNNSDSAILLSAESIISADRVNIVI